MGFDDEVNFYLKDGKAYTEDNVLVYNVSVYKVPKKISQSVIHKYFSEFGPVRLARLDQKPKRRRALKNGFIHFTDPLSAAKALMKHEHILQGKHFFVKARDSWEQPPDVNDSNHDMEVEVLLPSIFQLNDDCLDHICKKLKLHDQFRFARTCQRFRGVFVTRFKTENRNFDLDKLHDMTLWEIYDFFQLVGACMTSLNGPIPYEGRERFVEFIGKNCSNLKAISLDMCKIKTSQFTKMFSQLTKVTTLELHKISLNDNAIKALRNLPELRVLNLTENQEITGKHISKLYKLNELYLKGCCNILSTFLIEICKCLKELKTFDIQRCWQLTTAVCCEMATHCTALEVLKISCFDVEYEYVAELPRLKKLELLACTPITPLRTQLFVALAAHKADQLESLIIVARNSINSERAKLIAQLKNLKYLDISNNTNLTDDMLYEFETLNNLEELRMRNCKAITKKGLLHLLSKCSKLRFINIRRCPIIGDDFVLEAIELFKNQEQGNRFEIKKEPLVVYAAYTGILDYILEKCASYNEAKMLINVIFYLSYKDELAQAREDSFICVEDNFVGDFDDLDDLDELDLCDDDFFDDHDYDNVDDDDYDDLDVEDLDDLEMVSNYFIHDGPDAMWC